MKTKSKKVSTDVNQGLLLKNLAGWYGKSIADFAIKIDLSERWIYGAFKLERIPLKHLSEICRAFNIPANYFEGLYELPVALDQTHSDPNHKIPLVDENLRKENEELKNRVISIQQKNIDLYEELLRLQKQLANK